MLGIFICRLVCRKCVFKVKYCAINFKAIFLISFNGLFFEILLMHIDCVFLGDP